MKAWLNNWRPLYFNVALYMLIIYSFTIMTWQLLPFAILSGWLVTGVANNLLHRYYSHHSFKMSRVTELLLLPITILLAQTGGPIAYATIHRQHHRKVDTEFDPHSPQAQGKWMIMSGLWEMFPVSYFEKFKLVFARDLMKDPVLMFIHSYYHRLWLFMFITVALINWHLAVILFAWPVLWLKITGNIIINGLGCHRNVGQVQDLKWFAFLTFGESLHKFHHDNPDNPYQSDSAWLDPGMQFIKLIRVDK
jgi:stearoyl-CoA desaturase (delta-9 desaturase)